MWAVADAVRWLARTVAPGGDAVRLVKSLQFVLFMPGGLLEMQLLSASPAVPTLAVLAFGTIVTALALSSLAATLGARKRTS